MERTSHPGVYRRGGGYVAVYRRAGHQRKESVATFAEARALKLARDGEAQAERLGPTGPAPFQWTVFGLDSSRFL
jgi:hypothetical protein